MFHTPARTLKAKKTNYAITIHYDGLVGFQFSSRLNTIRVLV
jgi:hypothetical protein